MDVLSRTSSCSLLAVNERPRRVIGSIKELSPAESVVRFGCVGGGPGRPPGQQVGVQQPVPPTDAPAHAPSARRPAHLESSDDASNAIQLTVAFFFCVARRNM
ncbi:hypothetical protein CEXT_162701 [Caerostris extrusa]|uniref:Uncharacterized protein n=1 Tax=Caerostris extrusa TaxID=172846 RepID=A0AAV4QUE5_CAEEX|nr:hypothetical protein CEXT_162701 [Caerostris extrusa]